jgi:hypothetical protein
VALLSETRLKPHERFFIQNYHFYRTDRLPGRKCGTGVAVRKDTSHNHVDLPPLVWIESTGVCIPIGNSEVLLSAVYKSPGHACNDADINELLCFRHTVSRYWHEIWMLNTHFGITQFPTLRGAKPLNLLDINEFQISAPQYLTH